MEIEKIPRIDFPNMRTIDNISIALIKLLLFRYCFTLSVPMNLNYVGNLRFS